jgi:hypothetical protein
MYFFIPLKIPKNRSEHNCLISIVHIKSMVTNCGYAKESKTTTMVLQHSRIQYRVLAAFSLQNVDTFLPSQH